MKTTALNVLGLALLAGLFGHAKTAVAANPTFPDALGDHHPYATSYMLYPTHAISITENLPPPVTITNQYTIEFYRYVPAPSGQSPHFDKISVPVSPKSPVFNQVYGVYCINFVLPANTLYQAVVNNPPYGGRILVALINVTTNKPASFSTILVDSSAAPNHLPAPGISTNASIGMSLSGENITIRDRKHERRALQPAARVLCRKK